MTFCGGQRDALTTARVKEDIIRDAGPSTATETMQGSRG
jgi:hypothetical protein